MIVEFVSGSRFVLFFSVIDLGYSFSGVTVLYK